MSKTFSELVVEGPFMLVKGFLMGYKYSCRKDLAYFFHRKAGIRRETLKDVLQEYFELDSVTHLCIEDEAFDGFSKAVADAEEVIRLKIRSRREIEGARFSFHFEVFNRDHARTVRELVNSMPETLRLEQFKEDEYENSEGKGIELYAPLHDYGYSGRGAVNGEFSDLIELYRRFSNSGLVEAGSVQLVLKD